MNEKTSKKTYLIINILVYVLSICFFTLYSFDFNYLFVSSSFILFLALTLIIVSKYILLFNYFTRECKKRIRLYSMIYLVFLLLMVGTECVFYFKKSEISWLVRSICIGLSTIETIILFLSSNKFINYFYSEFSMEKEQQIIKEKQKEIDQLFIKRYNIYKPLSDIDTKKLKNCRKLIIGLIACTIVFLSFSFSNLDFTYDKFAVFRYIVLGVVTGLFFYCAFSSLKNIITIHINLKLKNIITVSTISILIIFITDLVLFIIEANTLFITEEDKYYPLFIILLFSTNLILLSTAFVFSLINIIKLLSVQNELIKQHESKLS